jgi:hypothetical protein
MDHTTSAVQLERLAYASDLTDYEWTQIEAGCVKRPAQGGSARSISARL